MNMSAISKIRRINFKDEFKHVKRIDIKDPNFNLKYAKRSRNTINFEPVTVNCTDQIKMDKDADVLIYEQVNKQIIDQLQSNSSANDENEVKIEPTKLYKSHPVIRKGIELDSFKILLEHCPLIELSPKQVLYQQNNESSWFYFVLAGIVTLKTDYFGVYGQAQLGTFVGEDSLFMKKKATELGKYQDTWIGLEKTFLLEFSYPDWETIKYQLQAIRNFKWLRKLQNIIMQSHTLKNSWK